MRLRNSTLLAIIGVMVLIVTTLPLTTLHAQDSGKVIISLAVSSASRDIYSDQMIADFQAAYPNITLNIVKDDPSIPSPTAGLDAYFTGLQTYTNVADVLSIDSRRVPLTSAATSAGYFLDLSPLVNGDKSANVDDFYPAVWQSFQWDKGIWALPTSTDALILSYDPAAFDKAGLAYPNDKWTLTDLVNAANKLTIKDASNTVTTPGLSVSGSDAVLFRSLLGENLFDANSLPSQPQIDKPSTEALLDAWVQLQTDGVISKSFNDFQTAPISIGAVSNFVRIDTTKNPRVAVMLPGGKSGLTVQGFAISAGTQHPEQAFALANFLTTRPELTSRGGIAPARKSLVGAQTSGGGNGGGPGGPGGPGRNRNLTPENQALIDKALANGIPPADIRFAEYLDIALTNMTTNAVSSKDALQAVDAQATQDEQAAIAKKSTVAVSVATPVPTPVLTAGKVAIKFGMMSFVSPLPNQDKWDTVINQFISTDPQVGQVVFDTAQRFGQLDSTVEAYDCFYLPYNAVPSANLGLLFNIDPFLTADSSFDKADVVGNVLTQLQRDNKTWGYPIVVQPTIMKYNTQDFAKANVQAPQNNWTVDAFNDAVKALRPDPADPAPFAAANTSGGHLLILMAAYGGLPLDYRTNPPTINFTDPTTVDAIRQVLDLAKNGYIKYDALSGFSFGGGRNTLENAIYSDVLNSLNTRPQATNGQNVYKGAPYPTGKTFSAASYTIGAAYISAKSQNPEACYRWISTIAKHPELFNAMPARASQVNNPTLAADQGADVVALYNQIDAELKDPNTVSLPALAGGGTSPANFLMQHWLYEAFDNYVLNNADLDSSLKDAEGYAKTYQGCVANIAPFDPSTQNQRDYNQQYLACATQADPRMKTVFGG
ncbi:MAG: hypothetical protein ABI947_26305 [Chloroflexota bacterium]